MATETKPDLRLAGGKGPDWWKKELSKSMAGDWKTYHRRGSDVIKRYRDERNRDTERYCSKRFNILYSNIETLGPAVYSQVPVADIRRRFQDRDPVGRMAAQVLQRAVAYCLQSYNFHGVLESCRQDYLLPGFAVARVKYKPYIKKDEKKEDGKPVMGEDGKPLMDESIVYQEAKTEYVGWKDFAMSRSRKWERVWWIAFGEHLTQEEVRAQFGDTVAETLSYAQREDGEKEGETEPMARVWEVWCKRGRGRFVIAEGYDDWIRPPEVDPLRLENFYPCPTPMWAVSTNETLVPVPEFCEYQDQADELDDLTERIDILTSALRRRGVYDAAYKDMYSMLTAKADNQFVAIENWAAFSEKGGLLNTSLEMPLEGIVKAVVELDNRRERVKQIIYEITGIGDIIRGASDPGETATAQDIKSRWAGLRISTRQTKFANFARDLVRLKAEIIAERFDPQTLSLMSGLKLPMQEEKQQWQQMQAQQAQMAQQPPQPPNPEEAKFYALPSWEEVIQVLRDDKLRGFKIDIETDSTVQPDADAEKNARTELLTAVGGFSQQMAVAVQQQFISPQLAQSLIKFALRAFKAGSEVEEELESMGETPAVSPQIQQKEMELQQREQKLMERETKVKDDEHGAQMATKDAKAAAADVDHKKEIFDLEQRMAAEVKAIQEKFDQMLQALADKAEHTVREIAGQPQGAVQ